MGDYMREIEAFGQYPLKSRDKIICLVGESGSGKTTIAKALEKEGYNIIHSYTTRPPREPNEWGHKFVDEYSYTAHLDIHNNFYKFYDKNPYIIAFKELYGYKYWALSEQYQGLGTSIYIIDPAEAEQVKENVKDAEIIVVYLKADQETRIERLVERTGQEVFTQKQVEEITNRIKKDKEYFKLIQCDFTVDANGTIEETLELVKKAIERG